MANIAAKTCVPCKGGISPFGAKKIQEYIVQAEGWEARHGTLIVKTFEHKTFKESIIFVNRVASLAEEQGHHPGIIIRYRKVTLEFTTHAMKGLSENDFIMAAKINAVYGWEENVQKAVVKQCISIKVLIVFIALLATVLLWKRLL